MQMTSVEAANKIMGRLMFENIPFLLKHDNMVNEPFIISSEKREWELDFDNCEQNCTMYIKDNFLSIMTNLYSELDIEKIIEEIKTHCIYL